MATLAPAARERAFAPAAPAPPLAPLPAAPPTVAPAAAEVSPAWRGALGAWLQSNKRYPAAARAAGQEGRVAVRFTVDRTGRVLSVQVVASSGAPALDEATRAMLAGAQLPPFPPGMTQTQLTMTVGIQYALER